jgi:UDP-N-acetylmuramoyl-L-alanyl-D-glutamate--2,6-diaminopimelate ligase
MWNLRELIEEIEPLAVEGSLDKEISGIASDSRKADKGYLFVAIRGTNHDGHDFILAAQAKGAAAIVYEQTLFSFPKDPEITYIQVRDTQRALALLAARFYHYPSRQLPLIGITGTNGKTTISYLLASILEAAGYKVGVIGTIAYRWGKIVKPAALTTPDATELQRMICQMLAEKVDYGILEVSSHALKLKRVDGCSFKLAIFTNLTGDHLDFHGDMQDYFSSKKRLFYELKPERAIVNRDDRWGQQLLPRPSFPMPMLTYGLDNRSGSSDIRAEQINCSMDGLSFLAQTPTETIPIRSPLTGKHNIYNILASLGGAFCLNIPTGFIQQGIISLKGVPGRFEKIDQGQDFAVVVDYAHTSDALENTLRGARDLKKNRLITVFGCGGDRDRTKRPIMGKLSAGYSHLTIITTDNPRSEDPLGIIAEIEKGIKDSNQDKKSYEIVPQRDEAIYRAISLAQSGDIVIIAGKGHEPYQIIGDRVIPFDDREIARKALQERLNGKLIVK